MPLLIAIAVSLFMLLTNREMNRGKLFLITFIISFIIVAFVHSADEHTGHYRQPTYRMEVIQPQVLLNGEMVNLSDLPITHPQGFLYYIMKCFLSTGIIFLILSFFIKRKINSNKPQVKLDDIDLENVNAENEGKTTLGSNPVIIEESSDSDLFTRYGPPVATTIEQPIEEDVTQQRSPLTVDEKTITKEASVKTLNSERKFLNKKSFVFPLTFTQKIIFSISAFLLFLVISYAFAESVDYKMRIKETWGVWVIFILIQAWLQNKIWNTNSEVSFTLFFPNISNLFKSEKVIKQKPVTAIKKQTDNMTLLTYGLVALLIILVVVALIRGCSHSTEIKSKQEEPPNPTTSISTPTATVNIENETVKKLLKEIDEFNFNDYQFDDPSKHLGFKFYSVFPSSLKIFSKNNKECKMGAELIDENKNNLKYTVVIYSAVFPEMSASELDIVLDGTPKFQIDNIYKKMGKECIVSNAGTKVYLGKQRAVYFDVMLKNVDGSIYKYSMIRSYVFYLKDGNGVLGFFLHSNDKSQLQKDFEEYKTVFEKIAGAMIISKTN